MLQRVMGTADPLAQSAAAAAFAVLGELSPAELAVAAAPLRLPAALSQLLGDSAAAPQVGNDELSSALAVASSF